MSEESTLTLAEIEEAIRRCMVSQRNASGNRQQYMAELDSLRALRRERLAELQQAADEAGGGVEYYSFDRGP